MSDDKKDYVSFYTHQATFSGLAASGNASTEIKVESDSDFFWYKATYFADISAAAQTESGRVIPLCTVLITDGGSDRQLMRSAVPVTSVFGTGEIPFILPSVHRFKASATISIAVTNFSAATTYNLRLMLIGYKKFRRG